MKRTILGLAIAGLTMAPAMAETLKVKPGLWEITTKVRHGEVKTPTNINQLPLEQRAKVMAKLEARNQQVMVKQSCLTKAQLDKGDAFTGGDHHHGCNSKAVSQTAKEWVTAMECSGKFTSKGEIRLQAVDQEHMAGTIAMTTKSGDKENTTKSTMEAKWLGADCSAVTANALAKKY